MLGAHVSSKSFDGRGTALWPPPVFEDSSRFKTVLYGIRNLNGEVFDWSLRGLQKPGDAENPNNGELVARLLEIAKRNHVPELLAPSPVDFNGRLCNKDELSVAIPLGDGVLLRRGTRADAIRLERGEALVISTGGCPVIVATGSRGLVVAHAGLKSLIREKSPTYGSVVTTVSQALGTVHGSWVFWSIRPEYFTHPLKDPVYGAKNERLSAFLKKNGYGDCFWGDPTQGAIDLPAIIRTQFEREHAPRPNRTNETYLPGHRDGVSHVGHTRLPKLSDYRNLILVCCIR